jgi:superfamily II DNA or RNA helicase
VEAEAGETMPFADTWAPYFQAATRMRGRAYYADGRVRRIDAQPGELIRAVVQGKQAYTVSVRREQARVAVQCTCPSYADGRYCKHIWATLLYLDERGAQEDDQKGDPQGAPRGEPEGGPESGPEGGAQGAAHVTSVDPAITPTATRRDARPRLPKARRREGGQAAAPQSAWNEHLNLLRPPMTAFGDGPAPILPNLVSVEYVIDQGLSRHHNGLVVVLHQRNALDNNGRRTRLLRMDDIRAAELSDPADRQLCALIAGSARVSDDALDARGRGSRSHAIFKLPAGAQRELLRAMIATGRCFLRQGGRDPVPLQWDDGPPWGLRLLGELERDALHLRLHLHRAAAPAEAADAATPSVTMSVLEPTLILGGDDGLLFHGHRAAAFEDGGAYRWVLHFRDVRDKRHGAQIVVPRGDIPAFLDRLYLLANLPELDLPPEVARKAQAIRPTAHIDIVGLEQHARENNGKGQAAARVFFAYGSQRIRPGTPGDFVLQQDHVMADAAAGGPSKASSAGQDAASHASPGDRSVDEGGEQRRTLLRRDHAYERQALEQLAALGLRPSNGDPQTLTVPPRRLAQTLDTLLQSGWSVATDEQVIRQARPPRLSIRSGIDWLELRGQVSFSTAAGEQVVDLSRIVAAARAGKEFLTLDDGSLAAMPTQWLNDHALLTSLGQVADDHLRFANSQAALLDALLTDQAVEDIDEKFRQMRQRMHGFAKVEPVDAATTFEGCLRTYQRDGVGWLKFLRWFGLGGILADDMGLGKTIQVLAMLDARRGSAGVDEPTMGDDAVEHRPSLVLAPRSVIFNWVDEARRFTPHLRVAAYAGTERQTTREAFAELDLVVTSYGLLRRDIMELRRCAFDYVILDEAQAIKNPQSQSAKAARLLQARHRLALTGTPVENHLGDLWSIFEFLNPGMLGQAAAFSSFVRGQSAERSNLDIARQTGQALRPFILRRTKKQVLAELPEKTEQTIVCQMDEPQRKVYDQLRDHYRRLLLKSESGSAAGAAWGGSTMLVLEALLRLRQAACHPALLDGVGDDVPSAKLDVLVEQLVELIEEQHKALVFSQFTSLLALVRKRLEQAGITYEYLDGRTRDREQRIARFQSDDSCPVFLISLKAGGLGLNLTAADYVFLLDPWWNPAVEQQAIDRAHRIGQTRHVVAYRLICEDTVEQRIAELQRHKKELAEAVIPDSDSILQNLTRGDLEKLLS